jgi:translation initiation factor IF-1
LAKEEGFTLEGTIVELLPNAMFRVKLDTSGAVVIGVISGRMRQNKIKILTGDRVDIEFSPYDLARGRITKRK